MTTTPEDAIEVLNRALEADPVAMTSLIQYRVPCTETLADDPTIQVKQIRNDDGTPHHCEVGLLGILNGIFGTRGDMKGWIAVYRDVTGEYLRFDFTPENCADDCGAKPK